MPDLKSGFDKMEATKATLLKSLASLDAASLNRKPDAATWSILQVIAHLTRSEAGLRFKEAASSEARLWRRVALVASILSKPDLRSGIHFEPSGEGAASPLAAGGVVRTVGYLIPSCSR